MRFILGDGEFFYFAGIWDKFKKIPKPSGDLFDAPSSNEPVELETFLILTTAANDVARPIHTRMPVIVKPDFYDDWLDPATSLIES